MVDWGTAGKRDLLLAVGIVFGAVIGSILTKSSFAGIVATLVGTGLALCILWMRVGEVPLTVDSGGRRKLQHPPGAPERTLSALGASAKKRSVVLGRDGDRRSRPPERHFGSECRRQFTGGGYRYPLAEENHIHEVGGNEPCLSFVSSRRSPLPLKRVLTFRVASICIWSRWSLRRNERSPG